MSRTRIVKGKITEIIAKDYNIYSESSIVDNAAEMITDKGVAKGESYGNPEKPSAGEILAKCMVQFRPHNGWTGEYGFDWVRVADTGQIGDKKWYRDIMGKYVNEDDCNPQFINQIKAYEKLLGEFKKYTVPWKKVASSPYFYIIPYLSLLPKNSAKLNLKVEVEEEPDSFELKFDNNFLDVKFNNELSIAVGKREIQDGLVIYCKKEFNSDQVVEILAKKGEKKESVGQVIIVKNGKEHRRSCKITFIKIIQNGYSVDLNGEEESLKKYFKQCYVDYKIQYSKLVLSVKDSIPKRLNADADGTFKYLDNLLRNNYNSNGDRNGNFFDDSFRIYYVPDICFLDQCGGGYLLGLSDKLPKTPLLKNSSKSSIIVFDRVKTSKETNAKLLKDKSTAPHELFHAIGLNHIFENESKYVFKEFETDNIMDYMSRTSGIIPKQTYKWQWDIIKKQLK